MVALEFCRTFVLCVAARITHPDSDIDADKIKRATYAWLAANRVRHALYRAQGSTAGVDPCIRKVEEDINGAEQAELKCQQAQLKCQQDKERLMQSERPSKADTTLLPLKVKRREELAKKLKQLREELEQLREKELLLLRQVVET